MSTQRGKIKRSKYRVEMETRVAECHTEGCGQRWYGTTKSTGSMTYVLRQAQEHIRRHPDHFVEVHTKTYYGKKP